MMNEFCIVIIILAMLVLTVFKRRRFLKQFKGCTEHEPVIKSGMNATCRHCGQGGIKAYLLARGWYWVNGVWRRGSNVK